MIDKKRRNRVSRNFARYLVPFTTLLAVSSTLLFSASAASAHQHKLKLFIGDKLVELDTPLYVDEDGKVYAPPQVFDQMGFSTHLSSDNHTLTIEDWRKSIDWQTQIHDSHPMVALADVTAALNSSYSYDKDSRTVTILAKILLVREDSDTLSVSTSFPVPIHSEGLDNPNRVYLDLAGATLPSPKVMIPVSGDDVSAVRAAQATDSTVRIVIDLKRPLSYHQVANSVPTHFELALAGAGLKPVATIAALPAKRLTIAKHGAPAPMHTIVVNVPVVAAPAPKVTFASDNTPAATDSATPADMPHVENITCDHSDGALTVYVDVLPGSSPSGNPYHAFLLDNPSRLAFDITGGDFSLPSALTENGDDAIDLSSDIAARVRWGTKDPDTIGGKSSARVVVDLTRDVEYQISSAPISGGQTRYTISIQGSKQQLKVAQAPGDTTKPIVTVMPDATTVTGAAPETVVTPGTSPETIPSTTAVVALPATTTTPTPAPAGATDPSIKPVITTPTAEVPDSVLSGKTIVVDPGHGGKDEGAPGVHGVMEKTVVLAIGKLVRDDLVACGAKVVMTRADDTFIPLVDRSQMGIDNHADFFVSIHADSSGVENSHHGTTVYYHANNATCRTFAESIAQRLTEIASDDGIQGDGVRSDFVRFPGVGFSVLRRSPEPSILVETGYVDSDTDCSHLVDNATQHTIASAIVAGLKDYVAQNTRTAKAPTDAKKAGLGGMIAVASAQTP